MKNCWYRKLQRQIAPPDRDDYPYQCRNVARAKPAGHMQDRDKNNYKGSQFPGHRNLVTGKSQEQTLETTLSLGKKFIDNFKIYVFFLQGVLYQEVRHSQASSP